MSNKFSFKQYWLATYADVITLLLTFFILGIVVISTGSTTIYKEIEVLLTKNKYILENNIKHLDNILIHQDTKGIRITIPSGKLFDENSASIKSIGKQTLIEISNEMISTELFTTDIEENNPLLFDQLQKQNKTLLIRIRVEGHTDNQTILGGKYKTNLELSSARAVKVADFLSQNLDISSEVFSAEGRSKFEPIATNTTEEGRALNRRVELYIDADIVDL
jgi:chemotaxis protein MotB